MTRPNQDGQDRCVLEPLESRLLMAAHVLFQDGFEDSMAKWTTNVSQNCQWNLNNYRAHTGAQSAFGSSTGGLGIITADHTYLNNEVDFMATTLNLSHVSDASITFWYWGNTENGFDYLNVYVNGLNRFSYTGNSTGWRQATIDLDNVASQAVVPIKFEFASDATRIASGAAGIWVDDISVLSSTPEPATLSLLAVGGLLALRRRRR
jgi:hypothetical protein